MSRLLSDEQIGAFRRDGVLVVPGFYDRARDIEPIQRAIHAIIGLVMKRHGLADHRAPFTPGSFDEGYLELLHRDRAWAADIYDAVKHVPAFNRLLALPSHEQIFLELHPDAFPAVVSRGCGIRIDNPGEERFRAHWHQEYPAQLRSPQGLVYWSPLVPISEALGPVQICPGSHRLGPLPVTTRDPENPQRSGAYALRLAREAELIANYPHIAPLTEPGDLVILDFLVLHASGFNRANRSRWSMQMRYFNFKEPTGIRIGWKGSFAAGVDFRLIHPELCAD